MVAIFRVAISSFGWLAGRPGNPVGNRRCFAGHFVVVAHHSLGPALRGDDSAAYLLIRQGCLLPTGFDTSLGDVGDLFGLDRGSQSRIDWQAGHLFAGQLFHHDLVPVGHFRFGDGKPCPSGRSQKASHARSARDIAHLKANQPQ